jgi:hypothetical protein
LRIFRTGEATAEAWAQSAEEGSLGRNVEDLDELDVVERPGIGEPRP